MTIFLTLLFIVLAVFWLGVVVLGPPYVPTLSRDLKKLIAELKLSPDDTVVDLGAGDGRVLKEVIAAGAHAHGVELNPFLVWIARFRLRKTSATVVLGDMWRYRLPEGTTYVFVFFAHAFMKKLENYCISEAKNGRKFRLVSYGFRFEGRKAEKTVGAFTIYQF